MYTIELEIFKIGDIIFKIGSIFKDVLNKSIFLEAVYPYSNNYNDAKEFMGDIIMSIFSYDLFEFCLFDSNLEKLNREEKLKNVKNMELLQYVNLILKK